MGYSVQYTNGVSKRSVFREEDFNKKARRGSRIVIIILMIMGLASLLGWHPAYLIPGDPAVTKSAFMSMLHQVEEGETIKTAVTTFCKEVISGAYTREGTDPCG